MIPWASPLAQYRAHRDEVLAAVTRVLESGSYVLGDEVVAFEREFAAYCGVAHAIGVGSGTDALILALKALGIGPGDEVITVSHTAVATVAAVLAAGAVPVLIDVEPTAYTLDPSAIEPAVTPRTKAVIAVHLYGQAADMAAIGAAARRHNLRLIEDCAQATGGRSGGRRLGSIGDIGCFSFYPTKNLGALGDGGMATTADAALAERLRRLRQYGWDARRTTEEPGLNSRLDPLQAAVLRAKLPHLDADNARRVALAERYGRGLAGLPLAVPAVRPGSTHVYYLYVIVCDRRDALIAHLAAHEIGSAVHYPQPAHRHGGYAGRSILPKAGLPVTDRLVDRVVTLPIYPELAFADVDRVIGAVREFFQAS